MYLGLEDRTWSSVSLVFGSVIPRYHMPHTAQGDIRMCPPSCEIFVRLWIRGVVALLARARCAEQPCRFALGSNILVSGGFFQTVEGHWHPLLTLKFLATPAGRKSEFLSRGCARAFFSKHREARTSARLAQVESCRAKVYPPQFRNNSPLLAQPKSSHESVLGR